jgi:Na+/proline symporter
MHLHWIDLIIIGVFLVFSIYLSVSARKTAESGLEGFFLGNRNLPWYLAGISMVATTFAADTPLTVTELVAKDGIAGNWVWWSFLFGGMLTALFFAALWRRAGVLTEVEFIELRYSGRAARILRMFKAVYLGVIMNILVMGWVNLAFMSLLSGFFEFTVYQQFIACGGTLFLVMILSSVGGLKGVARADAFQFILAMVGCILLAYFVLNSEKVGGVAGLKEALPEHTFNFLPAIGDTQGLMYSMSIGTFIAFAGVTWWASWYPGMEPGGGGYMAQRMMSTPTDKDAVKASLLFQLAHYCLRPWPWIIVALASLVLYPDLVEGQERMGFVYAIRDYMPIGLKGMLLAAFLGAYMSTISTQLNWGAGYVVNDFILPLSNKTSKEGTDSTRSVVRLSRLVTFLLMLISLGATAFMEDISSVWIFVMECGAGLGLVLILRWYWWRINVWSEITATVLPFLTYGTLFLLKLLRINEIEQMHGTIESGSGLESYQSLMEQSIYSFPGTLFWTVGITTMGWLIITFLTPSTPRETLQRFYDQVKPLGRWKGGVSFGSNQKLTPPDNRKLGKLFFAWIGGVAFLFGALFATGALILDLDGWMTWGMVSLAGGAIFGWVYRQNASV